MKKTGLKLIIYLQSQGQPMGYLILFSDLLCDRKEAHASPVKSSPLNRPNREENLPCGRDGHAASATGT